MFSAAKALPHNISAAKKPATIFLSMTSQTSQVGANTDSYSSKPRPSVFEPESEQEWIAGSGTGATARYRQPVSRNFFKGKQFEWGVKLFAVFALTRDAAPRPGLRLRQARVRRKNYLPCLSLP
jgi:hypothetical protein